MIKFLISVLIVLVLFALFGTSLFFYIGKGFEYIGVAFKWLYNLLDFVDFKGVIGGLL